MAQLLWSVYSTRKILIIDANKAPLKSNNNKDETRKSQPMKKKNNNNKSTNQKYTKSERHELYINISAVKEWEHPFRYGCTFFSDYKSVISCWT